MDPEEAASRARKRAHAQLKRKSVRRLAVESMTHEELWSYVLDQLDKSLSHGENIELRQMFYTVVRVQAAIVELYWRGEQLHLFMGEEGRQLQQTLDAIRGEGL